MKMLLNLGRVGVVSTALIGLTALTGCGRNEPGTMGGEPGVPETVATGAPAQAARETSTTDRQQPALASEHASSTFEDNASTTNALGAPDAATKGSAAQLPNVPAPDPSKRRSE